MALMLDRSEKTSNLLDAMMDALPFEVALMPELIANLAPATTTARCQAY